MRKYIITEHTNSLSVVICSLESSDASYPHHVLLVLDLRIESLVVLDK